MLEITLILHICMRHINVRWIHKVSLASRHHRTCSQHKKLDEAWAGIGRDLLTRSYPESITNVLNEYVWLWGQQSFGADADLTTVATSVRKTTAAIKLALKRRLWGTLPDVSSTHRNCASELLKWVNMTTLMWLSPYVGWMDASTPMSNHQINTKSHKKLCLVSGSVRQSVEAKLSFMTLVSIVVSDRLIFAMSNRHS